MKILEWLDNLLFAFLDKLADHPHAGAGIEEEVDRRLKAYRQRRGATRTKRSVGGLR